MSRPQSKTERENHLKHRREMDALYRWRKYARGLTKRGTPRRLRIWTNDTLFQFIDRSQRPHGAPLSSAEKNLARKRALRDGRKKAGLRVDGKPRQYQVYPELGDLTGRERKNAYMKIWRHGRPVAMSQREQDWRALRATMSLPSITWDTISDTIRES